MIYAETVNPSGIYPAFSQVFELEKLGETACKISVKIHHKSFFVKKFIFELVMGGAIKKSLEKFKQICEKGS